MRNLKLFTVLDLGRGLRSIGVVFSLSMMPAVHAQQLVVNGSFENYSAVPTGEAQWWRCNNWNNVNMSTGATATYATPDYYHANATIGNYDVPTSARGTISPHTGNAIMGLLCFNQVGASYSNFREYLSSQLVSPMVVGETYTVSFWMSNAEATTQRRYGSTSMGSLGIHFSTSPLSQPTRDIIPVIPQLVVADVAPWSDTWTLQTFTYTATIAWRYITIGNFTPTALQARTVQDADAQYSAGSYYFIDDVSVEVLSTLPIRLISFYAAYNDGAVELDWTTTSEVNNDFFAVERSTDLHEWKEVGHVPGAGNSVSLMHYRLVDHEPLSGTSYYRLKQTDLNGSISYSGVRPVVIDVGGKLIIYPNPTSDRVTIQADWENSGEFIIQDRLGQDMTSRMIFVSGQDPHLRVLDLSSFPAGVYIISTKEGGQKIIKL